MSVIGFDDLGLKPSPPLTTIRVDLTRVGEEAAERLFNQIEGNPESLETTLIPVELTIRGTTAPAFSNTADQTIAIPTSS
jgi:DNA-binding LacI/PurR family transcriptional regulator